MCSWLLGQRASMHLILTQSCWRGPRAELASSLSCFRFLNLTRTNVSTSKAIVQLVVVGDEVAHKSPEVCLSTLMHSTPPVYYENGPLKNSECARATKTTRVAI